MALELTTSDNIKLTVKRATPRGYAAKTMHVTIPGVTVVMPGGEESKKPDQDFYVNFTEDELAQLAFMLAE